MPHFVKRVMSKTLVLGLTASLAIVQLLAISLVRPGVAQAANNTADHLVISQIQVANAGGDQSDQFVELYNPLDAAVTMASWKLVRENSAGTAANLVSDLNGSVPAHGYFLIVDGAGYSGSVVADLDYSAPSNALKGNYTVILDDATGAVIDKVGYGTATDYETAAAPAPTNGGSIVRKPNDTTGNGTDTDNNSADFTNLAISTPHDSQSDPRPLAGPSLGLTYGSRTITATWAAVPTATSYSLTYNEDGSAVPLHTYSFLSGSSSYSQVVSGLTNGTKYDFTLTANRASDGATSQATAFATPQGLTNPASFTFKASGSTTTAVAFGPNAQVTTTITFGSPVTTSDGPVLTLSRPGAPVASYDAATSTLLPVSTSGNPTNGYTEWYTASPYVVVPADQTIQDGNVTAAISFASDANYVPGKLTSNAFLADTHLANPVVTVQSNKPGVQDGLTITTSALSDINIYADPSLSDASRVAYVPGVLGTTAPIYIGDNRYGTLYVVATDSLGNRSQVVTATNDITAPAAPSRQVTTSDGKISVSWSPVADAVSYTVGWRRSGTSAWSYATTTNTSYSISVSNGVAYDVAVTATDAAGNVSTDPGTTVTAQAPVVVDNVDNSERTQEVTLFSAMATTGAVATDGVKGGQLAPAASGSSSGKSSSSQSQSQGQSKASSSPTAASQATQPRDLSKAIVTIAILLILAGIAIAAYSWFRGEPPTTPPSGGSKPTPPATPGSSSQSSSQQPAAPSGQQPPRRGRGRPPGSRTKRR